ncbi:MAG TPA: hypothetical protein VN328_07395, partial [Thermodesulfovibrionales bacterium]|nr:hypothetical protein [Thermodesulfovibrionales bacterium]
MRHNNGVFMERENGLTVLLLSLLAVLAVCTDFAGAKEVVLSDEARACLGCHAKQGILKKFQNGETVNA